MGNDVFWQTSPCTQITDKNATTTQSFNRETPSTSIHTTGAVFNLINLRARVIICGQITQYNGKLDSVEMGPRFLHRLIYTRATIQGILARDYVDRMDEMLPVMIDWLNSGKLKYEQTVVDGFEQLPSALNALFHGKNVGKMLVRA